jgi:hypothetical protein
MNKRQSNVSKHYNSLENDVSRYCIPLWLFGFLY